MIKFCLTRGVVDDVERSFGLKVTQRCRRNTRCYRGEPCFEIILVETDRLPSEAGSYVVCAQGFSAYFQGGISIEMWLVGQDGLSCLWLKLSTRSRAVQYGVMLPDNPFI